MNRRGFLATLAAAIVRPKALPTPKSGVAIWNAYKHGAHVLYVDPRYGMTQSVPAHAIRWDRPEYSTRIVSS